MYNDWIDKIISTEKLPEYEFSPFPKSNDVENKDPNTDNKDDKENLENKENNDGYTGRSERPTSTAFLVTLFPVMMSIFFIKSWNKIFTFLNKLNAYTVIILYKLEI